jgi:uroporphyrinogen-III synthase
MNERRRRRALITRPQEDAADVAIALARRGITPVLAPMMRIEYTAAEIDNEVTLAQAVLFTSRNGVRAFTRLSPRRDVAAFAVGNSTADLARDNGFTQVESANGDSADLARLVTARVKPADGLLFHAAGSTVAGELVDTLNKGGFKTVRRALYEGKPVAALSDETATALRDRTLDYVLFFSPRTGRIFADLVEKAGLDATCDSLAAICLSEAVAAEISSLPWKTTSVAATPTTDALISVLGGFESVTPRSESAVYAAAADGPPANTAPETTATELPAAAEQSVETAGNANKEPAAPPAPEESAEPDAPAPFVPSSGPSSGPPSDPPSPDSPADSRPESPPESAGAEAPPAFMLSDPDDPPPARKPTIAGALPMALGIAAAALAAAYLTLPMWREHLPPQARERLSGTDLTTATLRGENTELKARIDDLDNILVAANKEIATTRKKAGQEIGALTSRLAASEKTANDLSAGAVAAAKTAGDYSALSAKAAALEKSLAAAIESRAAAEKEARQVRDAQSAATEKAAATADEMKRRIADLEKQIATARDAVLSAGKSDTIALAAGKLRDAVSRAAPFPSEIATLKRLGGTNPDIAAAIARIEPFAAKGVASRSSLFAGLPATVEAALDTTRKPAKTGWTARVRDKLAGFVTVRRIDGKGDGAEAILARAEIAARRGDLATAATEISALTGAAATAAGPWLASAQARLEAEAASAALDKIVLAVFAKGAGAERPGQ